MELHHDKHHATYVNSYNAALTQLEEAQSKEDIAAQIALKPAINFHGGGHLNHTLFWENLAPKNQGGGEPPAGALSKAIDERYGNLDQFKEKFNAALAGIQGSGWAWLVKDKLTGDISIKTYAVGLFCFVKLYMMLIYAFRTKILLLANSSPCSALMHGSIAITYSIKTARQNTSKPSGMSLIGRRRRSDSHKPMLIRIHKFLTSSVGNCTDTQFRYQES
jgi:superoxide dismutase